MVPSVVAGELGLVTLVRPLQLLKKLHLIVVHRLVKCLIFVDFFELLLCGLVLLIPFLGKAQNYREIISTG